MNKQQARFDFKDTKNNGFLYLFKTTQSPKRLAQETKVTHENALFASLGNRFRVTKQKGIAMSYSKVNNALFAELFCEF